MMKKTGYTPFTMRDVRTGMARSIFTFGSGFSGAGGADLGYALAGGQPLFAIELDPEAVRTFRRNFPETHVEHRDFREVSGSPEVMDFLLRQAGLRRGELDVLHLSTPCNEYCRLGPGPREGGTASLIFDAVNMTKVVLPRVMIIENVPDLGGRYRAYLDAALKLLRFDEAGRRIYHAGHMVLNAADYGVPQRRRRLIVIAVRADVGEAVGIDSDADVLTVFPAPTHAPIALEDALAGLQQTEIDLHPFRHSIMTSNLSNLARRLPHDPVRWMTPRKAGLGFNRYSTVRAATRLPSPTLTASGQQPDGRSGILHPTEDRKVTIREMMRASSFADDFVLTGTVGQAATRIGMSVPPLLTKAIGDAVYEIVLRSYHAHVRNEEGD